MAEENKEYKLAEVAKETELVIMTPDGKYITLQEAIIEILNKVEEIKKKTIG